MDVAVVDTGIDSDHPDLQAKVVARRNFVTKPETKAEDDNGHGTHVAGIAAAVTNNGTGIAGVCPGCRLLVAKVLDANGSGTDADIADGIVWAADNGAEVVNLSLGGPGEGVDDPEKSRKLRLEKWRGSRSGGGKQRRRHRRVPSGLRQRHRRRSGAPGEG